MADLSGNTVFVYGLFSCYSLLLGSKNTVSSAEVIVNTKAEVTLHEGQVGILPCTVERRLFAVYWKKGFTYQSSSTIVFIDLTYDAGAKGGEGYNAGLYNINSNYSLIIKNVSKADSGRYYCEVSDFVTGILFRNVTKVFVLGKPGMPKTAWSSDPKGTYILTWEPPVDTGGYPILSYSICICQGDGHSSFKNSTCTKHEVNSSVNALELHEVCQGHDYRVAVTASNEMGEGSPSTFIIDLAGDEPYTADMTREQNIFGKSSQNVTLICSITVGAVIFVGLIIALSIFVARKQRNRHQSGTEVRYSAVAHEGAHATVRTGVAAGAAAGALGGLVAGPVGAAVGATLGAGVGALAGAAGYGT